LDAQSLSNTRDSDVTLQLRYWEQFEKDLYDGRAITPSDLYKLTRLTSLSRARAKIQNTFGLFAASDEVRARRGKRGRSKLRPTLATIVSTIASQKKKTEKTGVRVHFPHIQEFVQKGPEVIKTG